MTHRTPTSPKSGLAASPSPRHSRESGSPALQENAGKQRDSRFRGNDGGDLRCSDPLATAIVRNRASGWTVRRMRCFLSLFEASGRVGASCAALGLSRRSVTKLRRRNPAFAAEWAAAARRREARRAAFLDIDTIPGRAPDHAKLPSGQLRAALSHADGVLGRRKAAGVTQAGTLRRPNPVPCQPNGNLRRNALTPPARSIPAYGRTPSPGRDTPCPRPHRRAGRRPPGSASDGRS